MNVFDNHASHEEFCLFNFCLHGSVQLQFFQVFMKHRVIDKVMVNETCTSDLNFVLPVITMICIFVIDCGDSTDDLVIIVSDDTDIIDDEDKKDVLCFSTSTLTFTCFT